MSEQSRNRLVGMKVFFSSGAMFFLVLLLFLLSLRVFFPWLFLCLRFFTKPQSSRAPSQSEYPEFGSTLA